MCGGLPCCLSLGVTTTLVLCTYSRVYLEEILTIFFPCNRIMCLHNYCYYSLPCDFLQELLPVEFLGAMGLLNLSLQWVTWLLWLHVITFQLVIPTIQPSCAWWHLRAYVSELVSCDMMSRDGCGSNISQHVYLHALMLFLQCKFEPMQVARCVIMEWTKAAEAM